MNLPAEPAPDHGSGPGRRGGDHPGQDAARRRRLDEIFGEVLPDLTADELDRGRPGAGEPREPDAWYTQNKPPHHG